MLKRLGFALECAGLLYLVCMATGLIHLWRTAPISVISVVGTLSAPAIATLVFAVVAALVPNLLGQGKLASPLNMTLPLVYMGLLIAVLQLAWGTDLPFLRLREIYGWSAVWSNPLMLVIGAGLQILVLTALTRYNVQ